MRQEELFPVEAVARATRVDVPGFALSENYLTASEEAELLRELENGPWETDWKRRIQQYGLGYSGAHGGRPSWVRDFPQWLKELAERVGPDAGFEGPAENCVINEYVPPQGIAPHKDYAAFGRRIACVSLGSDIVMDLIEPERGLKVPVQVPARSLWVLSGDARSRWQHGIAPRLADVINGKKISRQRRVSITFRTATKKD